MPPFESSREQRQAILKHEAQKTRDRYAHKIALLEQELAQPDPEVVAKTRKRIALGLADAEKNISDTLRRIAEKETKLTTSSSERMKSMLASDVVSEQDLIKRYEKKIEMFRDENKKSDEIIRSEHLEHVTRELGQARADLLKAQTEYERLEKNK